MRALKYTGPGKLEIQEEPVPVPGEQEVLLKVSACGICGSDVHGYLGLTGRRIAPMTMGHEFSAEVVGSGQVPESLSRETGSSFSPFTSAAPVKTAKRVDKYVPE